MEEQIFTLQAEIKDLKKDKENLLDNLEQKDYKIKELLTTLENESGLAPKYTPSVKKA